MDRIPERFRRWLRRRARRRRWRRAAARYPARPMSARAWVIVWCFAVSAVVVALGLVSIHDDPPTPRARDLLAQLAKIPTLAERPPHRDDYSRSAFGIAWTDHTDVADADNGCDTRNDILLRDLRNIRTQATSGCPRAVQTGDLRSPYTGVFVAFRRGRNSAAVQIDHIVPLSYAWDMGASHWSAAQRTNMANDPANLVAVDGPSNMDKSDKEPFRWMPPASGFHCQYASQFIAVLGAYRLYLDAPSRSVLTRALRSCA